VAPSRALVALLAGLLVPAVPAHAGTVSGVVAAVQPGALVVAKKDGHLVRIATRGHAKLGQKVTVKGTKVKAKKGPARFPIAGVVATHAAQRLDVVDGGAAVAITSAVARADGAAVKLTVRVVSGRLVAVGGSVTGSAHSAVLVGVATASGGGHVILRLATGANVSVATPAAATKGRAYQATASAGSSGGFAWHASGLTLRGSGSGVPSGRFEVTGTLLALSAESAVVHHGSASTSYALPAGALIGNVQSGDTVFVDGRATSSMPEVDHLLFLVRPLVAPSLSVLASPPASTSSTDATIAWDVAPAGAAITCTKDGGAAVPCASPVTFHNVAIGSHQLVVMATNAAGNDQAIVSWDVTPPPPQAPTVAFDTSPPAQTTQSTASLAWSTTGTVTGVTCDLDLVAYTPCTSPVDLSGLAVGDHVFTVTASNDVGSNYATAAWSVVTTPTVAITGNPGASTAATSATFDWTTTQHPTQELCTLDGGTAQPCTTGTTYTGLGAGGHTFRVDVSNVAGSAFDTFAWTVTGGGSTPTVSITTHPAAVTTTTTATFGWSTTGTVTTVQCTYDDLDYETCPSPITLPNFSVGTHVFRVKATGPGGVASDSVTWKVTSGGAGAPTVTLTQSPPTNWAFTQANFNWTTTGDVTDVTCNLDGAGATPCAGVKSYPGLATGAHSFTVAVSGGSGSDSKTYNWTIVAPTPPTISLQTKPANPTTLVDATFTWAIGTNQVPTLTCTLDSVVQAECSSPQTFFGLATGSHTLQVVITNGAGSSSASYTWTIQAPGTASAPPSNTALPTISGTPKTHAALSASNGTWANSPYAFTFLWRRCDTNGANCVDIPGATSNKYTATVYDIGYRLRVVVTATNSQGSVSATSAAATTQAS
jgi:hypothetical protein